MAKINWKKHLQTRLKVMGFLFALVGWFLITTVVLEDLFHQDLSGLESFMKTTQVKWGINFFAIGLLVILIKGQGWIDEKLKENKLLKVIFRIILVGGLIGWIVGLGSLVI